MPFIYSKASMCKAALAGLSLSLFIEFVQFFIGRECEIDDLICNVMGAVSGYLLYLLIKKLFPSFTDKAKLSVRSLSAENFTVH